MLELGRGKDFVPSSSKILSLDDIEKVKERLTGQVVVVAGGAFDLLHPGHITHLEEAKAQGDVLFVCVGSDEIVRKRKGSGRPVQDQIDRARVVAALQCVDFVVPMPYAQGAVTLQRISPDIWARGRDHSWEDIDVHYRKVVREQGIPIVHLGGGLKHSSELVTRIKGLQ